MNADQLTEALHVLNEHDVCEVRDLYGVVTQTKHGCAIGSTPIEFRYVYDNSNRLIACVAMAERAGGLVFGTARVHALDMGHGSRVKGRMIATIRLRNMLLDAGRSRACFSMLNREDEGWGFLIPPRHRADQEFWTEQLTDDLLDRTWARLEKRQ